MDQALNLALRALDLIRVDRSGAFGTGTLRILGRAHNQIDSLLGRRSISLWI